MSDINKMDFKQLRNEVQLLRDELAMFKRIYEDAIYNIDIDNLSTRIVKEKDDMRAEIKVTTEEISTKVSNEAFQSAISQTADKISGIVSEFIDTSKAVEVNSSDGFIDTEKIYVIRERDEADEVVNETFYYYNTVSEKWEEMHDSGIVNSLFEQTPDGFKLKGDVKVDGSCVLTESLTFDSSDRPVQVQYSIDGMTNWHDDFTAGTDKFMRLKIGADWTDAMKVVGEDGKNGTNGSNASVTPRAVFDALTDNSANQGIFSAFVDNNNQIYINAEYIRAGTLSGMTLENAAGTHKLQMSDSTGHGTFRLYNDVYSSVPYFSIYDGEFGNIAFNVAGEPFLRASTAGYVTVEPMGTWDFSDCTDVTWGNNAPVAVFG